MTTAEQAREQTATQAGKPNAKDRFVSWLRAHAILVNWFVSLVAAGLMLWAAFQWWTRALALTAPCADAGLSLNLCNEVPEYLQGFQFVVAVLGIVTAVTSAVLSVAQAILGRTLDVMRYVVGLVLACAILWVAAYWFGRWVYL